MAWTTVTAFMLTTYPLIALYRNHYVYRAGMLVARDVGGLKITYGLCLYIVILS